MTEVFKKSSFLLYSVCGIFTAILDLWFLYVAREHFHFHYLSAVAFGFIVATVIHYFLVRKIVFPQSHLSVTEGLSYFIVVSLTSLVFTLILVYFLVEHSRLHYLSARLVATAIIGFFSYTVNTIFFLNRGKAIGFE